MALLQIPVELALIGLLILTLLHAIRMERGRATLKRDRAALERLIATVEATNRQAEGAAEHLRTATESAARLVARHIESGANLKDDLAELIDRGERLRGAPDGSPPGQDLVPAGSAPRVRSPAERELLRALRVNR